MLSLRTEKRLFATFSAAFVLLVGGFGLFNAAGRRDVPQGFLWLSYVMLAVGGLLFLYALLLMFTLAFTPDGAHQKVSRRAKILARYLLSENGAVLTNEEPDPELNQKTMLKLEFEDGDIGDFECPDALYAEASIHRTGQTTVRGSRIVTMELDPE